MIGSRYQVVLYSNTRRNRYHSVRCAMRDAANPRVVEWALARCRKTPDDPKHPDPGEAPSYRVMPSWQNPSMRLS